MPRHGRVGARHGRVQCRADAGRVELERLVEPGRLVAVGRRWQAAGATGVQSPHYGDSLFHFFQGRYFTAVTGLMVSQHFARVAPHDDEAEVLRGGLFLSYGLHREAGDVFARLIERGATPPVRDRAWFYLAKIRYQRGLLAEAEDALGRIEQRLPGELEEDRVLLQANVQMARGRLRGGDQDARRASRRAPARAVTFATTWASR